MRIFVPGRTEIIGNHTDHQLGRVIASAVKPGMTARCRKWDSMTARVRSDGRRPMNIDLSDCSPHEKERGTSMGLIRGMASAMKARGYAIGGFEAEVRSSIRSGGGLSSSAAFCVLIGRIISELYNGGRVDAITLARCARDAENIHFGKPSGLMDQLACAVGKAVYIDFLTDEIVPLDCDFGGMGLVLCLTDTGGSHAGLTADYAAIRTDMNAAAAALGSDVLGKADGAAFLASAGDGSLQRLRAEHFFEENERVPLMRRAIETRDAEECMRLMNESGRSSEQKLRNIRCEAGDERLERGLALSAKLLEGHGAWRVHGGGFAGCVQALIPTDMWETYSIGMDEFFGKGSCFKIM